MSNDECRMSNRTKKPMAFDVRFARGMMRVSLSDGREIAVSVDRFERLRKATPAQQNHWRLIGRGVGIHWEEIDEDLSVKGLLAY